VIIRNSLTTKFVLESSPQKEEAGSQSSHQTSPLRALMPEPVPNFFACQAITDTKAVQIAIPTTAPVATTPTDSKSVKLAAGLGTISVVESLISESYGEVVGEIWIMLGRAEASKEGDGDGDTPGGNGEGDSDADKDADLSGSETDVKKHYILTISAKYCLDLWQMTYLQSKQDIVLSLQSCVGYSRLHKKFHSRS
jgi:hypothetical protein